MYVPTTDEKGTDMKVVNPKIQGEKSHYGLFCIKKGISQVKIISRILGYILAYIHTCGGKNLNIANYFFNLNV